MLQNVNVLLCISFRGRLRKEPKHVINFLQFFVADKSVFSVAFFLFSS